MGDHAGRVDSVEQRGDTIVVAFSWSDRDENRHRWAHLLTLREDLIVDMRDHASPRAAAAALRLRGLLT